MLILTATGLFGISDEAETQIIIGVFSVVGALLSIVIGPLLFMAGKRWVESRLGPTHEVDADTGERRERPTLASDVEAVKADVAGLAQQMEAHMRDQAHANGEVLGRLDELSRTVRAGHSEAVEAAQVAATALRHDLNGMLGDLDRRLRRVESERGHAAEV